jgi:hypothetical protein
MCVHLGLIAPVELKHLQATKGKKELEDYLAGLILAHAPAYRAAKETA